MQENNNQPLEINRELDKSLLDLLTIVFQTELEQSQLELFEMYEIKVL